jgi:hypothetical protein
LLQPKSIVPHGTRRLAKYGQIPNLPCPKEVVLERIHGSSITFPRPAIVSVYDYPVNSAFGFPCDPEEQRETDAPVVPNVAVEGIAFDPGEPVLSKGSETERLSSEGAAAHHSPQLLMAAEKSPPTVNSGLG